MTVIRTTDDLLKALKEHPEWKAAVRMEILGEELIRAGFCGDPVI